MRRARRARRRWLARSTGVVGLMGVATAAMLLVLLGAPARPSAATGTERAFPPLRPTRVLVLGDSVAKGAVGAIPGRLPGREVVVDAEVNRSTGVAADRLAEIGVDWDVVVVLIAHNDGGSAAAYQPAARRIVDQLGKVPRVTFLTLHEVRPEYASVNAFWRTLEAERANVSVADWGSVAAANPGALAGDGLHLNGAGASLLADVVGQEVERAEADWDAALRALAAAATTTTLAPATSTTTTTSPPTTTSSSTTTTTTTTTTRPAAPPTTTAPEPAAADPDVDAATPDDARWRGAALAFGIVGAGAIAARRQRLARSR